MKLISLYLIDLVISNNIMFQTVNHLGFQEVFLQFANQKLSTFIQKGATLQDLNDHVEELRKHLADDQEEDDNYFNEQQQSFESGLQCLINEVKELKEAVVTAAKKISVLNQQQQIIDNLFSYDQNSYQKRLANQNVIHETISILVERVHGLSQEDNLLEETTQFCRGKNVEVWLKYNANQIQLFIQIQNKQKKFQIFQRVLEMLQLLVWRPMKANNKKILEYTINQQERLLHLFQNLRYIINYELSLGKEDVKRIGQKLQDRNDSRQLILDRVKEAQQLLNDNLDRIARWSQE